MVVLTALASSPVRAGDFSREWKTIETAHFVVHYYKPLDDVARRAAVVAERAHRVLAPAFVNQPKEKTHITLVDDTDGSNGFAAVLPRNSIRLFATAPTGVSSLADHDDWLYSLITHEYTHVLHLDSIAGLPALVNRIFGKTWAPNQIQPRWVIEGLATYEESKHSSAGRTRHAQFDSVLRLASLTGTELRLDELSHSPRAWPRGNAAYLYGSHFLKYVFDTYGDDKVQKLSWSYGSNAIPWSLNRTMRETTGETFIELHEQWREFKRSKYAMQNEQVERLGRREGRQLTFSSLSNTSPRYTVDGQRIVWVGTDGLSKRRYAAMPSNSNTKDASTYAVVDDAGPFDLLSDGRLVVEQTRTLGLNYTFQEIAIYDPKTKETLQLTTGARVREPTASPDERHVAFSLGGYSQRSLAVMELKVDAAPRVVWSGSERYDQAFSPAWSPTGDRIAFIAWRTGGFKDVLVVDVESGETVEIQHDRAQEADPVFSPDGRFLLFSSDRSGIYNLYAHELETRKLYQVTNVLGCALSADISPDSRRLVYQGCNAHGTDLYEMPYDPTNWIEAPLYINDRPDPVVVLDDEAEVSAPRNYRPLATLAPRTYTLELATGSFGQLLQLSTDGSDIVGRHNYRLAVNVGLENGDVSYGGSYSYSRLWPSLRFTASRNRNSRRGVTIDDERTRFVEEALGLTASIGLPVVRSPAASSTLSIDYDFDYLRNVKDELDEYDPNDQVPQLPETNINLAGLALRWTYSDRHGFLYSVGPRVGKQIALSLRMDHPAVGSDFQALSLNYRWNWWRELPWGVTPTLAVRLAGGVRTTNRRRVSTFALGGAPTQDVVDAIINTVRAGNTGFLRGYPRSILRGTQYHLLNLEYRQELLEIEHGISTLPLYIRRLHFAGLFDAGNAFDGKFDPRDLRTSIGASLRMDMVFGYFMPGALEVGYSRGLNEEGINEFWLVISNTL